MQSNRDRGAEPGQNGSGGPIARGRSIQNTETRLLIGFFQQAIQVGEAEPDPTKYLEKFRSEIKTTGRFFAYLGLAKADKRSPLGWKPTAPLLDLIAKSKARRPKATRKSASPVDRLVLDLLLDSVLGDESRIFLCWVLIKLGLVLEDVDDNWMATPDLVQLFGHVYYVRQLKTAYDPDAVYEPVYR
jgi:hypothetical protein